ncbi:3'(2'),5'-bisphosphate nucleotidase CysQ [Sphingomonas quercus]|uniref:3'(2'),5'-bisphosphate nucleotidase CysQ n=1 Tax=Sphingomonas quercus TaxID=2842451 RepID=A0ABS6BI88_9SPHN|nr:3'(2'),5'-bisphosphate nucleotidase CysQ [Sphingomonas quercus]
MAEITARAGQLALAGWRGEFRRWEKSPGQIVCELDLEVDEFLKRELCALLPDAGWLSEETADDPARLEARRVWVVDPIDGTRDFVRGRDGWCVSVALVDRWQVALGVLDAPARGQRWTAAQGEGAALNGRPLAVRPRTALAGARVPADSLPRVDQDLVMVAKPNSIALRLAMVAAGEADLVASLRWGNEWDIAAAALIGEEAGATVTDALGMALSYNTPTGEAFGILATAPGIHAAALARLRARAEAALPR